MIDAVNLTRLQIIILAAFVMISSGVVFHLHSFVTTSIRLGLITQTAVQSQEELFIATYTMFAGMLLANLFLVSLKDIRLYYTEIYAHTHMYYMHNLLKYLE